MKIVKIWGGLGNQLFQFSFGQYLFEKTGEKITFIKKDGYFDQHSLYLKYFNIKTDETCIERKKKYDRFYFNFSYRIQRKFLLSFPFLSKSIFVENTDKEFRIKDLEYELFDGYWQSIQFIEPIEDVLRKKFSFKFEQDYQKSKSYQLISSKINPIAVHIRRGDYLNSKVHYILDLGYYKKAMNYFISEGNNPTFFFFSDDKNWLKQNFILDENYILVEEEINSDILDFYLISRCKNQIIANSTFSWWAAWLNEYKDKTIIAPEKWYNINNELAKKLIPKQWITM